MLQESSRLPGGHVSQVPATQEHGGGRQKGIQDWEGTKREVPISAFGCALSTMQKMGFSNETK